MSTLMPKSFQRGVRKRTGGKVDAILRNVEVAVEVEEAVLVDQGGAIQNRG